MVRWRWASAAWVLAAGCALGPASPDLEYVARVNRKRGELDERLRNGETTPFTPVDVRMVPLGESVTFGACEGEASFEPAETCSPRVTLRYTQDGFRTLDPSGAETEAASIVPLDRFRLALSRQEDRGRILVHDPAAPAQQEFERLRWFPPDDAYRHTVQVEPYDVPSPARMATTAGLFKTFQRYGRVRFTMDGRERSLSIYLPEGADPTDPASFFIPFRDATAGTETYPVGRYVTMAEDEAGDWILDFNLAGNPNCAYNPHWNCAIPPQENVLDVAIRAGELPYGKSPDH